MDSTSIAADEGAMFMNRRTRKCSLRFYHLPMSLSPSRGFVDYPLAKVLLYQFLVNPNLSLQDILLVKFHLGVPPPLLAHAARQLRGR